MKKTYWMAGGALVLALAIAWALGLFQGNAASGQLTPAQSKALVREHSPTLGAPNAKVTLVEFLDPACGACAAFYPIVKQILNESDGKLRLVVRYAPFHKGSDQAVIALEAARQQGKYWSALEAVLQNQSSWVFNHQVDVQRLWAVLASAGVDVARAQQDAQDTKLQAVLDQDLLDLNTLEVIKTPSFFVGDRALLDFGPDPLRKLVTEQIQAAYAP